MLSYITVEEFRELLTHLYISSEVATTTIPDLSDSDLEVLLHRATRFIDSQLLAGAKTPNQELQFPRLTSRSKEVPQSVKYCVADLVYHYCRKASNPHETMIQQGIKKITTIETTVEFDSSVFTSQDGVLQSVIEKHLSPYLFKTTGGAIHVNTDCYY